MNKSKSNYVIMAMEMHPLKSQFSNFGVASPRFPADGFDFQ